MTGSILVRGLFANPVLPGGHRLTAPGRFVRVRLPIGEPHRALLVIDRALASDAEGQKYVYVLDAEDKVQSRRITTGALQPDGLRAVEEGLEPEDWVLSGGILQTRQGGKIKPERVPMPTLGSPPSGGQPASAPGSSELQAVDKAE